MGQKRIEYRTYVIAPGALAIHAASQLADFDPDEVRDWMGPAADELTDQQIVDWANKLPRGKVIGTVEVIRSEPCRSRWGNWANHCRPLQTFPRPIWAIGSLGLWDWDPDMTLGPPRA